MRYRMLEAKCMELNIPCLMTAHHAGAFSSSSHLHSGNMPRCVVRIDTEMRHCRPQSLTSPRRLVS